MVLGICGKYCSGKNEAARILAEAGWRVIDADALGHEVLEEQKAQVAAAFGQGVLNREGGVDRKKLGGIVFKNSAKLKTLEAIVHPHVARKIADLLALSRERTVIHAALLFSGGLDRLCDRLIIVEASLLDRINRALARDNLGILAVFRRIWKQRALIPKPRTTSAPGAFKGSFPAADTITVRNSGTRGSLREAILAAVTALGDSPVCQENGSKYGTE
jgi:dephospho-CoA kinase